MKKINFFITAILGLTFYSFSWSADNQKASEQTISDSTYFRKNPVSGKVKQPDEEYYQDLERLNLNQSDKNLETETLADGSQRVNLQGRFMQHSAVLTKDGKVRYICLDHTKDLHKIKTTKTRAVK